MSTEKQEGGARAVVWVAAFMLLVTVLATCSGCASIAFEDIKPIAPPAICSGAKDCEAKWAAARRWVSDHAGFKIQTYAADYMQTYGPLAHDMDIAVAVSKEPLDGDRYKIVARIGCGNSFGCMPEVGTALDDFNRTVAAAGMGLPGPPAGSEGGAT